MHEGYFSSLPLTECSVSINGIVLENRLNGYRTSSVSGRDDMSSDILEKDIGDAGRTIYLDKKNRTRDIIINFHLTAKDRPTHKQLSSELRRVLQEENAKFIFADEPDVYWIGTVSDITFEFIDASGDVVISSTGDIVIHCSDPNKYSLVEKSFQASVNADGNPEVTIVNNGTVPVPIHYEITHHHENGYIGIVSNKGMLQLGKAEETDWEMYKKSEVITNSTHHLHWANDHKWVTDTGVHIQNSDYTTEGTFGVFTDGGHNALGLNLQGSTNSTWNGALKTITLKNSDDSIGAKHVYSYMNSWFEMKYTRETGIQVYAFIGEDNKCVCAQIIYKNSIRGNKAKVDLWLGGNNPRIVNSYEFIPSKIDYQNPFSRTQGHSDMLKDGSRITFHYWGGYPSYVVPELADVKVTKVQLFIGQYGSRGMGREYLYRNYFRGTTILSNTEHWRDVPNRYQPGDAIFIDGSAAKVYVNGMNRIGDETRGSKYFLASPGETKVEFLYSSFCTTAPTISAKIREAWS